VPDPVPELRSGTGTGTGAAPAAPPAHRVTVIILSSLLALSVAILLYVLL
jgi:hypothetical protein